MIVGVGDQGRQVLPGASPLLLAPAQVEGDRQGVGGLGVRAQA